MNRHDCVPIKLYLHKQVAGQVYSASQFANSESKHTKLTEILPDYIKEQAPILCSLQETHFKQNDINRLKGQKKIYHANSNQNEF